MNAGPQYLSYKFRLYPFPDQEREIIRQFEELRFLWNHALEQRQEAWRKERRSLSYVDQCRDLARWRAYDVGGIGRVYGHVAQETLARLDEAFRHFFRRIRAGARPGFPRFKREVLSLCYPDSNNSAVLVPGRNGTLRLHLSKIGEIPIQVSRALPEGPIKTCIVKRESNRWYAILNCVVTNPPLSATTTPSAPVGVDLGVSHLAVLSTGEVAESPKFLDRGLVQLRRQQRKLCRKQRGSHNWQKQKSRVARYHAKVRDRRRDFAHKLTSSWVERYDLIAFEDFSISGLLSSGHLSRSISDAGWGMLRQMTAYKRPGERVVMSRFLRPVPLRPAVDADASPIRLSLSKTARTRARAGPLWTEISTRRGTVLARALAQIPGGHRGIYAC